MKNYIHLSFVLLISTPAIAMDGLVLDTTPQKHVYGQNGFDFYETNPNNFGPEKRKIEKGLNTHQQQLCKFNKYLNTTTNTLKQAQPLILAWAKTSDDRTILVQLPFLTKTLEEQTTYIEAWLAQLNSSNPRNTASFTKLREAINMFEKSCKIDIESYEKLTASMIANDLSHPVLGFSQCLAMLKKVIGSSLN